jgi:hypothetical protein
LRIARVGEEHALVALGLLIGTDAAGLNLRQLVSIYSILI